VSTQDSLTPIVQALASVQKVTAAIVVIDAMGIIRCVNDAACWRLNLRREDIVGRSFDAADWKIIDNTNQPIAPEQLPFSQVMATNQPVYGFRHSVIDQNSKRRLLEIDASPVLGVDGVPVGVIAVLYDITQREKALRFLDLERRLLVEFGGIDNLHDVYRLLLGEIASIDGVASCGVFHRETDQEAFQLSGHIGMHPFLAQSFAQLTEVDAVLEQLTDNNGPVFVQLRDILSISNVELPPDANPAMRDTALALVPFRYHGATLGGLAVRLEKGEQFDTNLRGFFSALAAWLGTMVHRKTVQTNLELVTKQLTEQEQALSDANTALRVLVSTTRQTAAADTEQIQAGVRQLILPFVSQIRHITQDPRLLRIADVLEMNLEAVGGSQELNSEQLLLKLTPTELEVASRVRLHRSTKEIADELSISVHTVSFHRKNIRRKLGIRGAGVHLGTALLR